MLTAAAALCYTFAMLLLDEQKQRLKALKNKFDGCCEAFNEDELRGKLNELTEKQQDPDLYKDLKRAQSINTEAKYVSGVLDDLKSKRGKIDDIAEFIAMAESESDEQLVAEVNEALSSAEQEVETLHLKTLLKGEYDHYNTILSLHAGAGGTEAQDWTQMLYRMYKMYCDKNGFSYEELDYLPGDEAGIKSVTFRVSGANAYGYLKAEKGVHRLVRISPFDSNARRHTSFASLEVMPEIEEDENIKINPEDLRVDTYRSGGAGGQHINKTDSAVRITHIPTGIVVQCQNERSQIQNRETAMKMLLGKLVELREREREEKANAIKGEMKKIEWGSQIRSYVFQPYTMVKDHRTGYEKPDVQAVMDGDIAEFIFDYLRKS